MVTPTTANTAKGLKYMPKDVWEEEPMEEKRGSFKKYFKMRWPKPNWC